MEATPSSCTLKSKRCVNYLQSDACQERVFALEAFRDGEIFAEPHQEISTVDGKIVYTLTITVTLCVQNAEAVQGPEEGGKEERKFFQYLERE